MFTVQRFRGGFAQVWRDSDGKRHRRTLDATDRKGAEAEARRLWTAGQRGVWTVGRIVEAYMADRAADGIASATRQQDAWKAMRLFWGEVDPANIDKAMCKDYTSGRKVAAATARYELGMLAVALRWAKRNKHIKDAAEIWRPDPPERKIRHLTHGQFEKFFAAVKAPHARLYVLLGLYTLARPAAILQLTWDRIDFEREMIDLNPKGRLQTRKRRPTVPLHPDLADPLKEAFKARQTEYVIERGAQPVANIKKAFQAASERCGIHVTPYSLRHTGAVWAVEAGASMDELAQLMGHDDATTTARHYARFSPAHLKSVVSRVQRKVA